MSDDEVTITRARYEQYKSAETELLSLQAMVEEAERERDGLRNVQFGISQDVVSMGIARDCAEAEVSRLSERIRGAESALKEVGGFLSIILASPFWKDAIDPVRDEVQRLHDTVAAARSLQSLEGGGSSVSQQKDGEDAQS